MSAPSTLRPSTSRSRRTAVSLLSVLSLGSVVLLAGCGVEDRAAAGEIASPSVSASPTSSPAPTPTSSPEPSPSPSPDPTTAAPADPGPAAETPAPAAAVATPRPAVAAPAPVEAPEPLPAPAPAPAVQPSGSPSTGGAQALFTSLNAARSAAGLTPLAYSAALESVASGWTSSMAASGVLAHNPSYSAQIPAGALTFGENVGYAGGFADDAATIHAGWMDSAGHRENILRGGFTQVGIGYVVAADGTAWATQVFASY